MGGAVVVEVMGMGKGGGVAASEENEVFEVRSHGIPMG